MACFKRIQHVHIEFFTNTFNLGTYTAPNTEPKRLLKTFTVRKSAYRSKNSLYPSQRKIHDHRRKKLKKIKEKPKTGKLKTMPQLRLYRSKFE